MTHLKDTGPLLVTDFSVVAHHKPLEVCASFWLREIPNDLCGEKAFLQLYMRQEGELLQAHGRQQDSWEAHSLSARSESCTRRWQG